MKGRKSNALKRTESCAAEFALFLTTILMGRRTRWISLIKLLKIYSEEIQNRCSVTLRHSESDKEKEALICENDVKWTKHLTLQLQRIGFSIEIVA